MRLRKVKNAFEDLCKDTKYFVPNPKDYFSKWNELVFKNNNPIHIEVGCGKGQFMMGLAQTFPNINFIAIEKYDSVLIRTLEKALTYDIPNLRIVLLDANMLSEVFDKGEVSRIYLNFSDPWPKARHAKRRLTSSVYLDIYKKILPENGEIYQKTDNRLLFESSLVSFSQNGWYLSNISLDLHKEEGIFNIQTEYEEKWSPKGPIYRLEARQIKGEFKSYPEEETK
jgi:tRNA (guanine-N7-)-methyltransferase